MFWLSLVVFGFSALEFWFSLRLRMDFSFFVLWSWLYVSFNSLDYILTPAALHYSANLRVVCKLADYSTLVNNVINIVDIY